jgi:hypothetical protein
MIETQSSVIAFLESPRQDSIIRLHVSRNTLIAIILSVLLHALLFWASWPIMETKTAAAPKTIQVTLAPPPKQQLPDVIAPPAEPPAPPPEVIAPPPQTKKPAKKPAPLNNPEVMTQPKPSQDTLPVPTPNIPSPPIEAKPDALVDMMALVKQNREKREQAEREAARINAEYVALENGPSPEDKRQQKIMENLKIGTSGIFEVKRIDARSASFTFKGWQGDYSAAQLRFYEVEAGGGQDIRRLMVRRMIGLIREHYDGDFEWISHRLGKTVTKSAKIEDHADLEHFLMQEFFGTNYLMQ